MKGEAYQVRHDGMPWIGVQGLSVLSSQFSVPGVSSITVRRHLDAPVSSTGQAYQVRHDGMRRHSGAGRNPA